MQCSLLTLANGNSTCGDSQDYSGQSECISLVKCEQDITRRLEGCGISEDASLDNEVKLLLARAGKRMFTLFAATFK